MSIIAQKCGTVGNQALCFGFCLVVFCLFILFLFSACVLCFAYMLHFWGKQKKQQKKPLCVASDGTSLIIKTKHTHLFTVVTGSPATRLQYQQDRHAAPQWCIPSCTSSAHTQTFTLSLQMELKKKKNKAKQNQSFLCCPLVEIERPSQC